jgi:large subunit ribosomal protein L6e
MTKTSRKSYRKHKFLAKIGGAKKAAPKEEPAPKYYPADDSAKVRKTSRKQRPTKLKSGIAPGTVLILLSGRFRGSRVVYLKQLASGCLVVTGPFCVNGVPLRRVNQAYVIATKTTVDLSGVKIPDVDDAYFTEGKAEAIAATKEDEFFNNTAQKTTVSDKRKADQAALDTALLKKIEGTQFLKSYLASKFSLSKADKPHEMVF